MSCSQLQVEGVAGVCTTGTYNGSTGNTIHNMMYSSNPVPPHKNASTHNTRTSVTSKSRYVATPAQTPPIFLSVLDRINFRELRGGAAAGAVCACPALACFAPQ